MTFERLHTVAEAANLMRLSKGTVYRLIREDRLRKEKVGQRGIRVPESAIEDYLASQREPQPSERPSLRLVPNPAA